MDTSTQEDLFTGDEFLAMTAKLMEGLSGIGINWKIAAFQDENPDSKRNAYSALFLNDMCDTGEGEAYAVIKGTSTGISVSIEAGTQEKEHEYETLQATLDSIFS